MCLNIVQSKFSSVSFYANNLIKTWKKVEIENSQNFRKFPPLQNSRNFPWKVSKIPGNFPALCIPKYKQVYLWYSGSWGGPMDLEKVLWDIFILFFYLFYFFIFQ